MKRLFIIILVPLLAISLAASAKISFERLEVDFGEVESGKNVDMEFKFKNIGDEDLIIKSIQSSCGCTAAKLEKKEYKPGEEGAIPVQFISKGYTGKISKTITVGSNDPDNVYTTLKISGVATLKDYAEIRITGSDRLDFKEVTLGEKRTEKIKIKNTGTIDLRIIDIVHSPEITFEFGKAVLAPDEETEVVIGFKAMQLGKFATFPRIRTNAYRQRQFVIKVSAMVKSNG